MAPTSPTEITEWLARWIHRSPGVGEHLEWLSEHLEVDGGLGSMDRAEVLQWRQASGGMTDIRVLALLASDAACAITFEGQDPVTALHHRCSWLVFFADGKVRRIITTEMVVPAPDRA